MSRCDPLDLGCVKCADCALGQASGIAASQICPFITRTYARGETLCSAGEPAGYVWFVKEGVVALGRSAHDPDRIDALRLPGSYIGLEALMRPTYLCTARVLARTILCGAPRDAFLRWTRRSDDRLATMLWAALADPLLVEMAAGEAPERPPAPWADPVARID